jgi:hypothetical protein
MFLFFTSLCERVLYGAQREHSGEFLSKPGLTTKFYVTRHVIKYLCACDGSLHNSLDINVMYGTLSARGGWTNIIHCTMQRMAEGGSGSD